MLVGRLGHVCVCGEGGGQSCLFNVRSLYGVCERLSVPIMCWFGSSRKTEWYAW